MRPNSNHGTFYYSQLGALQILVGDNDGAKATVEDYFTGKYKSQISANGDQVRVHFPCHCSLYPFLPTLDISADFRISLASRSRQRALGPIITARTTWLP